MLLIIITSLSLCGCESDPILSPQVEVAEEAGGSYGNTNIPTTTTGNTENTANDQQHNEINNKRHKITNPKRF
ncbi:hypothetical protein F4212_01780 [Candidatus Poribacteria bacterium]|nr:hypothetical protein [Candidatus Poribacteria bacterium]